MGGGGGEARKKFEGLEEVFGRLPTLLWGGGSS